MVIRDKNKVEADLDTIIDSMVIRDKNGVAAVLGWGNKWYEPITPTGFMQWITDNPSKLPNVRLRPPYMLALGLW